MENNNKAIIITFHCVPNYGAALQAYSLQEYLKKYYKEVYILDYRPDYLIKGYKNINFYSLKSIIGSLLTLSTYIQKKQKFKKFEKQYLNLTAETYTSASSLPSLQNDSIYVGSDQIWNPQITNGFDIAYFGQWNNCKARSINSYAASLGKVDFTSNELTELKELILKFNHISIREKEASQLIYDYSNIKPDIVLDPTLLAGRTILDKLVIPIPYKNYILIYNLNNNKELIEIANKISKELNLIIIEIKGFRQINFAKSKHKIIQKASPSEFVSLIYNSSFVVTDSFHGTAFSILYHKPFITYPHKTRGGRMVNILNLVKLSERLTTQITKKLLTETIDWIEVDKRLEQQRNISDTFIQKTII